MKNFPLLEQTLSNGLRTVLVPRSEGATVTFLVLMGVGSRYETPKQAGLSHFLEHMFFKGTATRPTTQEIAEAIENVGGEFNAFTGEEYTGYYVKVAADYLEHGAEVVSDILLRPLFPAEEIERERGVIIEEIRMYTDLPMRHVWHLWNQALFGDHPLGRRIDGSPQTVSQFTRKDFLNYTRKHYHTGNGVVAVAGRFDPAKTTKLLQQLFDPLPKGDAALPKPAPKRMPAESVVHEYRKSLDQTHLIVGVPGLSLSDERRFAAEILATILGSGMSSRLFMAVRERHGLAYAVRTMTENLTDTGSLATQVGARTDKASLALQLIVQEYNRIMEEPVPAAELTKAKQMLKGNLVLELEETNALAMYTGGQALLRRQVLSPEEISAKIEAITANEVQTIAQELLAPERRALVVLGPQRSTKAFEKSLATK